MDSSGIALICVDRAQRLLRPVVRMHSLPLVSGLLLACLLASCVPSSTRPVVKLGLIAPFEGLYRRTGYAALDGMRLAIQEQQDMAACAGLEFLPLALNDTNLPHHAQRSAQKLLLDPSVRAIIGPTVPETARAAASRIAGSEVLWMLPFIPDKPATLSQRAFVVDDAAWAAGLISTIGQAMQEQGAQRAVVAGWTPGWPPRDAPIWRDLLQMPVLLHDEPAAVQPTDAVLWLGHAAGGAAFYTQLRRNQADVPFWMGPQGGDPVFAERVGTPQHVYWAVRLDSGYEPWARSTQLPASAYRVYRATQHAIEMICREHAEAAQPSALQQDGEEFPAEWRVFFFAMQADGASSPVTTLSLSIYRIDSNYAYFSN